jgi:hypothetical protein
MLRPVLPLSFTPRDEEKVDAGEAGFFGTFGLKLLVLLLVTLKSLGFDWLVCLRKRVCGETLKDEATDRE